MANIVVAFEGWNSSTQAWGSAGWGQNVAVPGATAGLGSVTVSADANVTVTGVAGTGSVGSVTVSADANVDVTGAAGTTGLGSVVNRAINNIKY